MTLSTEAIDSVAAAALGFALDFSDTLGLLAPLFFDILRLLTVTNVATWFLGALEGFFHMATIYVC